MPRLLILQCSSLILIVTGDQVWGEYVLNMQPGVTSTSRMVFDLHMLIFWICLIIGMLVFGVLAYTLFRHRKSQGATPSRFRQSLRLELTWTLVPLLILVGMAIPATRALILMEDTSDAYLTIKVTGYQWRWHYDYLDLGIDFFSGLATDREAIIGQVPKSEHYLREVDKPLVLPVGRKIRFLTTSNDVIHAWWVPALGWKKDAIPGFINDAWTRIEQPGVYRGQCAELCGKDHAFMPVVVVAKTDDAFQTWVEQQKSLRAKERTAAEQTWAGTELMTKGETVYLNTCAACHQPDGKGIPGTFPALIGSEIVTGPLAEHLNVVLNGRPGTAMQSFGPQLSDVELASVVTYERNAFGGSDTQLQPAEVKNARIRKQAMDDKRGSQ